MAVDATHKWIEANLEQRLLKSKWLTGDSIAMIDFWVGAFACDEMTNPANPDFTKMHEPVFKKCTGFKRYVDDFKEENKAWLAERPARPY